MKLPFIFTLLVVTVTVTAQQRGPQTLGQLKESPAGSKILNYVTAINRGEDMTEEWVKKQFVPKLITSQGMDKLIGYLKDVQTNEQQLSIYEANRLGMFKYKLKAKSKKTGEWLDLVFTFEESEPYRIAGYTIESTDNGAKAQKPLFPTQ